MEEEYYGSPKERTGQQVAEERRRFKIGKSATDAVEIKLDRVRKLRFKSSCIRLAERTLNKKSWKILINMDMKDWSHDETIFMLFTGLLDEYPDLRIEDVDQMWDATPALDRMMAMAETTHAFARAIGSPVDEAQYKKAVETYNKQLAVLTK